MHHEDSSSTAIYTTVRDARTAGAVMRLPSFGALTAAPESGDQVRGITGRDSVSHRDEGSEVPRNHAE